MLTTMPILLALLHPTEAPHLHANDPSGALWPFIAAGLVASVAVFLMMRRTTGSRNSVQ